MLTHTHYALLIAIPSGTVIVAHCVLFWYGNRLLKKLYSRFDSFDQAMINSCERMNVASATIELRARFK